MLKMKERLKIFFFLLAYFGGAALPLHSETRRDAAYYLSRKSLTYLTYIFNLLNLFVMFTILTNGQILVNDETKSFGKVLNETALGKSFLVEANGKKFKLVQYWKSQKQFSDKPTKTTKGSPTGNKTTFVVKWTGGSEETFTNDTFRDTFCTEYEKKKYERDEQKQNKVFSLENLEVATAQELEDAIKTIQAEQEKRQAAKEARKAALLAELAELDK